MNLRIEPQPTGSALTDFAGQRGAGQTGTFRGEPVQVRTGASGLADAAEEISFAAGKQVEEKTHAQRNIRAGDRPRSLGLSNITRYLERARHAVAPDQLEAMARTLLQPGSRDPGRAARDHPEFRTPTERYLLLQFARQLGLSEGASPEVLERIEDALADLEAWFGKAIEANLATIEQAGRYADSAQEVRAFQGSLQVVLGQPSLAQALQQVLQLAGRGGSKLEPALSSLMEALGACLAATRSNAEKALLQTLVTDLYHLKSLQTLLEDCKSLVRSLRRQKPADHRGTARQAAGRTHAGRDGDADADR